MWAKCGYAKHPAGTEQKESQGRESRKRVKTDGISFFYDAPTHAPAAARPVAESTKRACCTPANTPVTNGVAEDKEKATRQITDDRKHESVSSTDTRTPKKGERR